MKLVIQRVSEAKVEVGTATENGNGIKTISAVVDKSDKEIVVDYVRPTWALSGEIKKPASAYILFSKTNQK